MSAITCPEMHITLTWPSVGRPTSAKPLLLFPFILPPSLSAPADPSFPPSPPPLQTPAPPLRLAAAHLCGLTPNWEKEHSRKHAMLTVTLILRDMPPPPPPTSKNGDGDCLFFLALSLTLPLVPIFPSAICVLCIPEHFQYYSRGVEPGLH